MYVEYRKNPVQSVVAYICNTNTQEAEAGELQVQGQPGLYKVPVSKK
jgi:hypothetical protein